MTKLDLITHFLVRHVSDGREELIPFDDFMVPREDERWEWASVRTVTQSEFNDVWDRVMKSRGVG